MLVIRANEMMDCGIWDSVGPVDGIKRDSEAGLEKWLSLNAEYAKIWPNISVKKAPPLDSKEWEGKPDKFQYFLPNPGARPLNEVSSSKSVRLHAGAHFDHAACPYSVTQAGHAFGLCAMV